MATGVEPAVKVENKSEQMEYFPYDEETTDIVIRVDDTTMHMSRGTLMQASSVFRKMLSSNGKQKQAEITLPEKAYEEIVLFLRCISPMEFVKLDGKICHKRVIIGGFFRNYSRHISQKK